MVRNLRRPGRGGVPYRDAAPHCQRHHDEQAHRDADGAWLLLCSIWSFRESEFNQLPAERFSNVYRSTDNGESFALIGSVDYPDRYIDENMLYERADGSIVMMVRGKKDIGIAYSTDGGATWSDGLLIDGRNDVSYPDMAESPDGFLNIIYDFNRYAEKEILIAHITEADILAGRLVTDGSRMQIRVNKATGKKA